MLAMVATGTCNTLFMKSQNYVVVGKEDDGSDKTYEHPFFQALNIFFGELLCLAVYFILKLFKK